MTERLVVVGNGMVSLRFLERLGTHAPGRFDTTVIGQETSPAYNRVLLSALLAGDMDEAACRFRDAAWYETEGHRLRTGQPVSSIDVAGRTVSVGRETLPYDRLVLAIGSSPIRLPKPGMDLPGIVAFRDLAHVDAMRSVAGPGARAVVIGGGLLGLEAAYGLARIGVETTLLHVRDRLMERQLDARAGRLVLSAMQAKGVRVILGADTAAFEGQVCEGEDRVRAVRLADGEVLPADLVVVAVGVRPLTDLAKAAGLAVDRGIVVDDRMTTSVPEVHAIGECVEHRGAVYGLVEPGYEQADVLARHLGGQEDVAYAGSVLATSLKVSGMPVFSAGEIADDAAGDPIVLSDPRRGVYRKLLVRDGRLSGALLVGDLGESRWYMDLIRTGESVTPFRDELMFGRAEMPAPPAPLRLAA